MMRRWSRRGAWTLGSLLAVWGGCGDSGRQMMPGAGGEPGNPGASMAAPTPTPSPAPVTPGVVNPAPTPDPIPISQPAPTNPPPGGTTPPDPMTTPKPPPVDPPPPNTTTLVARLDGFRLNGLQLSSFSTPGATLDAIRRGGLSTAGLRDNLAFTTWFDGADAVRVALMKYLAACALAAGDSASYTDKAGRQHTFAGDLGLARTWATPGTSTDAEKALVSACLLAHANTALPQPRHIQMSLRGPAPLPALTPKIGTLFRTFDGVFFGDLFAANPKRYICRNSVAMPANFTVSLLRDWGRECFATADGCAGAFTLVDCAQACERGPGNGYDWGPCTVDGRRYPVMAAFVPTFARAAEMTREGGAQIASCQTCLDGRALDNLMFASAAATYRSSLLAGDYLMDIRYAYAARAGAPTPAYLRVEVDGVAVRDGATDRWEFPATGGIETWKVRTVPIRVTATSRITLRGASAPAPRVDSLTFRMP